MSIAASDNGGRRGMGILPVSSMGVSPALQQNWPPTPGRLLRSNALAIALAAGLTVAVQLWAYWQASSLSPAARPAAVLLAGLAWIIIAAPAFAASGRSALDGLLRGGTVLDASLVMLAVLAACTGLSAVAALKIYLLWTAVVLAVWAWIWLGRTTRTRCIFAVIASAKLMLLSAAPFWLNGLIQALGPAPKKTVATLFSAVNPALATLSNSGLNFIWNERPIFYDYSLLGRDLPLPTPAWGWTLLIYAAAAIVLVAVRAWLTRNSARRIP